MSRFYGFFVVLVIVCLACAGCVTATSGGPGETSVAQVVAPAKVNDTWQDINMKKVSFTDAIFLLVNKREAIMALSPQEVKGVIDALYSNLEKLSASQVADLKRVMAEYLSAKTKVQISIGVWEPKTSQVTTTSGSKKQVQVYTIGPVSWRRVNGKKEYLNLSGNWKSDIMAGLSMEQRYYLIICMTKGQVHVIHGGYWNCAVERGIFMKKVLASIGVKGDQVIWPLRPCTINSLIRNQGVEPGHGNRNLALYQRGSLHAFIEG